MVPIDVVCVDSELVCFGCGEKTGMTCTEVIISQAPVKIILMFVQVMIFYACALNMSKGAVRIEWKVQIHKKDKGGNDKMLNEKMFRQNNV